MKEFSQFLVLTSFQSFLKFSLSFPKPFAPFFDCFFSFFLRTRRLEIQSGGGCVAQAHFSKKPRLQIFARKQINQFINRILRHFASLFGKFPTMHNFRIPPLLTCGLLQFPLKLFALVRHRPRRPRISSAGKSTHIRPPGLLLNPSLPKL